MTDSEGVGYPDLPKSSDRGRGPRPRPLADPYVPPGSVPAPPKVHRDGVGGRADGRSEEQLQRCKLLPNLADALASALTPYHLRDPAIQVAGLD